MALLVADTTLLEISCTGSNQRLAVYLDDWFLLNAIKKQTFDRKRLKAQSLGSVRFLLVNKETFQLVPVQHIVYIGGMFQLNEGLLLSNPDRV